MFLILYAKISDNKKRGLEIDGPFFGPECETMQIAHEECRKIVTPSKDHILVKVFDLDEYNHDEARESASTHFNRIFNQMSFAQTIYDTPKRKKF